MIAKMFFNADICVLPEQSGYLDQLFLMSENERKRLEKQFDDMCLDGFDRRHDKLVSINLSSDELGSINPINRWAKTKVELSDNSYKLYFDKWWTIIPMKILEGYREGDKVYVTAPVILMGPDDNCFVGNDRNHSKCINLYAL